MKQIIELNITDIKHLVAKEFDVNEDQVDVRLRKVYQGYGMGEHKDYEVSVVVNKVRGCDVNEERMEYKD